MGLVRAVHHRSASHHTEHVGVGGLWGQYLGWTRHPELRVLDGQDLGAGIQQVDDRLQRRLVAPHVRRESRSEVVERAEDLFADVVPVAHVVLDTGRIARQDLRGDALAPERSSAEVQDVKVWVVRTGRGRRTLCDASG